MGITPEKYNEVNRTAYGAQDITDDNVYLAEIQKRRARHLKDSRAAVAGPLI